MYDEESGLTADSCIFYTSLAGRNGAKTMTITGNERYKCMSDDDPCKASISDSTTETFTAYVEGTDVAGNTGTEDKEIIMCTSSAYDTCQKCLDTDVTKNKCAWLEWSTKQSYCSYKSDYDETQACDDASPDCQRATISDNCP